MAEPPRFLPTPTHTEIASLVKRAGPLSLRNAAANSTRWCGSMHRRERLANARRAAHVTRSMRGTVRALLLSVALSLGISPSPANAEAPIRKVVDKSSQTSTARGRFKLVTYNVAGLPDGVSQSQPSVNMGTIGKLLNRYDLALVQEDFAYAAELRRLIAHPHVTPPFVRGDRKDFGDGLSQFAKLPFAGIFREAWRSCHGIVDSYFDCLTPKGFTFARVALGTNVSVDIYNLHMDAGSSPGDVAARAAQIEQLANAIERFSVGQAVIVAGDTNMGADEPALATFQARVELMEVCRKLGCPDPERIDRVFYRSSPTLTLEARRWRLDKTFVDRKGKPLSDHLPVAVDFDWKSSPELSASTR
jgi:endonuclease/exonuclease/phosphatase family metal-dependent hydrolase